MELPAYLLAAIWGVMWALVLQTTMIGRFLAQRRTWLSVVIGVGVDVLILWWVLEPGAWTRVVTVIGLSSVGIVGRSLYNELHEEMATLRAAKSERAA